jgi:hypothetical protein
MESLQPREKQQRSGWLESANQNQRGPVKDKIETLESWRSLPS